MGKVHVIWRVHELNIFFPSQDLEVSVSRLSQEKGSLEAQLQEVTQVVEDVTFRSVCLEISNYVLYKYHLEIWLSM